MARKQFNYILAAAQVTIQRLAYADPDAEATVAEEKTFDVAAIPETLANGEGEVSLAAYGLSQILQDRVSSLDADEKLEGMDKVFEQLQAGEFKAKRASSGGGKKPTIDSYFAEGLARFLQAQGKDVDANTAVAILQSKSADERKALRQHEDIKAYIEKAKADAAEAAGQIDLESLL